MKYLSTLLPLFVLGLASATDLFVVKPPPDPRKISVSVGVDFDDSFPGFATRAVNGVPTKAYINVMNLKDADVLIQSIQGSLWSIEKGIVVKNFTSQKVGTVATKGQQVNLSYQFTTDMHPQDITLNLALLLESFEGRLVTVTAYNDTISIIEAPTSLLDPQILFLYLILAAAFGGSAFFVYNTWLATVIPKTKRTNTDQVRLVRPAPVTAPGSYDKDWIPEHLLPSKKPVRTKSGTATKDVKVKK